jgi:hypothetical protein
LDVKQQLQTRLRKSKAAPGSQPEAESISEMIERVAQEHRQRGAAAAGRAEPPPVAVTSPPLPELNPEASTARPEPSSPVPSSPIPSSSDTRQAICPKGHAFVMLRDHPVLDGEDACPLCMAETIQEYRRKFAAAVRQVRFE